tara:strand:- start:11 stop:136 length:126 start_codon:yes stop_codon:yes gene_type:complete
MLEQLATWYSETHLAAIRPRVEKSIADNVNNYEFTEDGEQY